MDDPIQRDIDSVQLNRTPIYRRRRVPESFEFSESDPNLGTLQTTGGPLGPYKFYIQSTGALLKPLDNFVNEIDIGLSIYGIFQNSGLGTLQNWLTGYPVLFEGYAGIGNAQPFTLRGSAPVTGANRLKFAVHCPIYSFRLYMYGMALFQQELAGVLVANDEYSATATLTLNLT